MRGWLSCNRRPRHRSNHETGTSQSESRKQREPEEECGEAKAIVGEGRASPSPPQAGCQPEAAAERGGPEGSAMALGAPLRPAPLTSQEVLLAAGLQHCPPATLPGPCEEVKALIQELEAVREFQSCHCRERRKDLRSCQDCRKSIRALQERLQIVKSRLCRVEAELGIRVPPHELDAAEETEVPEGEGGPGSGPPAPRPDREGLEESTEEQS